MNLINSNTNLSKYKHVSFKERVKIETYLAQGMSVSSIAKLLNRSRTTIYKEIKYGTTTQIKQNKKKIMYLADTSQAVYERNRKNSKKPFKILQSYDFIKYVQEKFYNNHWSLDSIYKRAKLDNLFNKTVCTKTLYNYLDLGLLNIKVTDLPFKVKRNLKKSRVKKHKKNLGKSIDLRPKHIESREEFGHWEIDTVIGKYGANDDVILTLLERKTRNYIAVKIKDKTATSVKEGLEYVLSMYKDKVREVFKSITCDNGLEFASLNKDFSSITDIYYAHPYSSWERGSNERHNGLLRRFIPKYTTIKEYTKEQILYYSDIINAIPRKILRYKTPEELFESCLDSIYSV